MCDSFSLRERISHAVRDNLSTDFKELLQQAKVSDIETLYLIPRKHEEDHWQDDEDDEDNQVNWRSTSLLGLCCWYGRTELIRALFLNKNLIGQSTDAEITNTINSLEVAVEVGNIEILNLLASGKVFKSSDYINALRRTVDHDTSEVAEWLITKTVIPIHQLKSAFDGSVHNGNLCLVKTLWTHIKHHSNLIASTPVPNGYLNSTECLSEAFGSAAYGGHLDIINFIIDETDDQSIPIVLSHKNNQPLCSASRGGWLDVVTFILDKAKSSEDRINMVRDTGSEYKMEPYGSIREAVSGRKLNVYLKLVEYVPRIELDKLHKELFKYAPIDLKILQRLLVSAGCNKQQWIANRFLFIFYSPYHVLLEELISEVNTLLSLSSDPIQIITHNFVQSFDMPRRLSHDKLDIGHKCLIQICPPEDCEDLIKKTRWIDRHDIAVEYFHNLQHKKLVNRHEQRLSDLSTKFNDLGLTVDQLRTITHEYGVTVGQWQHILPTIQWISDQLRKVLDKVGLDPENIENMRIIENNHKLRTYYETFIIQLTQALMVATVAQSGEFQFNPKGSVNIAISMLSQVPGCSQGINLFKLLYESLSSERKKNAASCLMKLLPDDKDTIARYCRQVTILRQNYILEYVRPDSPNQLFIRIREIWERFTLKKNMVDTEILAIMDCEKVIRSIMEGSVDLTGDKVQKLLMVFPGEI